MSKVRSKSAASKASKAPVLGRVGDVAQQLQISLSRFFKSHWRGTLVILIATLIFFWPLVIRAGSYSIGGDAMFNAWTLARDHHCILRENCKYYADGNIYFPHKDTMLYSETQLSAGLLSLPFFLINQNPLFSYNIMTIASFFLAGWFMYLLARYLSKGNELFSIVSGLVFEFAPFKMAAVWHLQNLSIFCLPLVLLLALKYVNTQHKKYLYLLFPILLYQFYASWYQMVFMLIAVGLLLLCLLLFKLANLRMILMIALVTVLCAIATLPLARQYVQFSKQNKAVFGITDQELYASSLSDYFIPYNQTAIGKVYYHLRPGAQVNSYNLDSYSYHGLTLYAIGIGLTLYTFRMRKKGAEWLKEYKEVATFAVIGLAGFILSLGPLLKLKGSYTYGVLKLAIPLPYIFVDKFLPQLSFIRAIGRVSALLLFSLCCFLAYFGLYLNRSGLATKSKLYISILVCLLIAVELMPLQLVPLGNNYYAYNLKVPAVYQYIKSSKDINDIIVLQNTNYPGVNIEFARPETVLWAGYDNKDIFNGYSGYTPNSYFRDYTAFVDYPIQNVAKMKSLGLKYILVDKLLTKSNPNLVKEVSGSTHGKAYEDSRYALFKI